MPKFLCCKGTKKILFNLEANWILFEVLLFFAQNLSSYQLIKLLVIYLIS